MPRPLHWRDRQRRDDAKVAKAIQSVFAPLNRLINREELGTEDRPVLVGIREQLRAMLERYLHDA